ncbi:MAG: protein-disulfide reductase DsbD domain-containing protein, partial [Ahrensia sp.]
MTLSRLSPFLATCLSLCIAQTALAETIVHHDGGVVQVFFEPVTPDSKKVRGVIAFDNEPGWKSYWRDPGSSGIPPQINIMIDGQSTEPELHFPVPQWVSDDYGGFIGYVGQTNVPFEIAIEPPLKADATINLDLFAGICREVCIPIAGHLSTKLPHASAGMTSIDQLRIQRSFDALPSSTHPGVRDVRAQQKADGRVVVTL